MALMLLHLSDIHFREGTNPICDKLGSLISAVQSEMHDISGIIAVLTGDIAHSGKVVEYEEAERFFKDLSHQLEALKGAPVPFAFVPGNHDCDFAQDDGLRQSQISNIRYSIDSITPSDTSISNYCTSVQSNFRQFLVNIHNEDTLPDNAKRLCYRKKFNLNGDFISIECINTAWISQINEKQGQMFYPISMLQSPDEEEPISLVVSIFHHPYGWLEANNVRAFKKRLEWSADIILTGHEHESLAYSKTLSTGDHSNYVEGAVLQTSDPNQSGFNIVKVDLVKRQWKVIEYGWDKSAQYYKPIPSKESPWQVFERAKHSKQRQFDSAIDFADYLLDAGVEFTHPSSVKVRLDDIYVYPDVSVITPGHKNEESVLGDKLIDFILKNHRILIVGGERSGKSSLAKSFYGALQQKGLVPVLIEGKVFKGANSEDLIRLVRRQYEVQYSEGTYEQYRQLSPTSKVLLIDDIQNTTINIKSRDQLIDAAIKLFGYVIILVDQISYLRELSFAKNEATPLLEFHHCSIKELGHERRAKLIERWYSIGQDHYSDPHTIEANIAKAEKTIGTLLGRNLLPAYPIFILTILQTIESQNSLNMASGSYGYIYEALIVAALAKSSKKQLWTPGIRTYL